MGATSTSQTPGFVRFWEQWLGYRIPHYDAMERAATKTLAGEGTATVRVGFNGSTEQVADWHVSLFTRAHETPDASATLAAAKEFQPAGVVLHHVVTDRRSPHERPPRDPRSEQISGVVGAAFRGYSTFEKLRTDHRAPQAIVERASRDASRLRTEALVAVERGITDGLHARHGFLLVPPLVIGAGMLQDYITFRVLLALRAALDEAPPRQAQAWRPRGICVCRACTTVFLPRRRSVAEYCRLCRKRPAVANVFGQRPLLPGTRQTVRVPEYRRSMIVGWKAVTIGVCASCGQPFHGRRDKASCDDCSGRIRQQRHREQARTARVL